MPKRSNDFNVFRFWAPEIKFIRWWCHRKSCLVIESPSLSCYTSICSSMKKQKTVFFGIFLSVVSRSVIKWICCRQAIFEHASKLFRWFSVRSVISFSSHFNSMDGIFRGRQAVFRAQVSLFPCQYFSTAIASFETSEMVENNMNPSQRLWFPFELNFFVYKRCRFFSACSPFVVISTTKIIISTSF